MAGKDIIMLTQEELKKLHIIHKKEIEEKIKQIEAAAMISLSERQIRRLTVRVR